MINNNSISFKAIPQKVRQINPKLFASGRLTFEELKEFKKEGLTQVIDLRSANSLYQRTKELIFCTLLNIKRKSIPVNFVKKLPPKELFIKVKDIVDKNPNKTLIHCNSGKHRTNIFCMGVQVLNGEKKVDEAVDYMLSNKYREVAKKKINSEKRVLEKLARLETRLNEFIDMFSKEIKK